MPVDARPFLLLSTPLGSIKCARPRVTPLSAGLTGTRDHVTQESATHTIKVYVVLGTPPSDLEAGTTVTVEGQPYVILKNGISRGPGVWTLYVRALPVRVSA